MDSLWQRVRRLGRSPGFTLPVVLTLGLATTFFLLAFTFVDRVLFAPLPFGTPERLVQIGDLPDRGQKFQPSLMRAYAVAIRVLAGSFESVAYGGGGGETMVVPEFGGPPIIAQPATADLLDTLQVRPIIGRGFTTTDTRAAVGTIRRPIMISYELWIGRFGGATDVVDRRGSGVVVVGVLPRGFMVPSWRAGQRFDALALVTDDLARPPRPGLSPYATVPPLVARLKPGVTLEQARAEVRALVQAVWDEEPATRIPGRIGPTPVRVERLRDGMFFDRQSASSLAIIAVAVLAILAGTTVVVLTLVRAVATRPEAALHLALGAPPRTLVAAAFIDSLWLAAASTGVAVILTGLARAILAKSVPEEVQTLALPVLSARTMIVAVAVPALVTCAAAIVAALLYRRPELSPLLNWHHVANDRRGSGTRAALLVFQTAVSVALLASAVLVTRSFLAVGWSTGFEADRLVRFGVNHGSKSEPLERLRAVLDIARDTPGVVAVGAAETMPFLEYTYDQEEVFWKERGIRGATVGISGGLFQALGTPLLAGRFITDEEVQARAEVAVLNEHAVQVLYPTSDNEAVLGRQVRFGASHLAVVGVVTDIKPLGEAAALPTVFIPITSSHVVAGGVAPVLKLVARTRRSGILDVRWLRASLDRRFEPNPLTLHDVGKEADAVLARPRFLGGLMIISAIAALLAAVLALYSTVALGVSLRCRDLGIRRLLGATRWNLTWSVVQREAGAACVGTVVGLTAAYFSARVLQSMFDNVSAHDVAGYALAVVLIALAVLVGIAVPAARIAMDTPLRSIRKL